MLTSNLLNPTVLAYTH